MKKFIGIIFLAVVFSALILTSCDNQKAGTFAVKFSWAKDDAGKEVKPDVSTGEFFVTVRIYEWKEGVTFPGDIAANGKQLTQSDSAQMKATGTSIDFGDLSYGSRRFVVAEIRKGEELTNSVLFTGMSKLFDFEPGKHTEVNVEMKLTPTPGVDEEGNRIDAELRIVDDNGNLRSYTSGNDLKVKLRLLNAVSFTHVYFANKEENLKTANGKLHKIGELKEIKDVDNGYELDGEWDLSFGLTTDEIAVSPELKVYARLENEYGTGLLVMAKIALDNQKPELTLGLNPAYTNGSKAITLNISANELIKHDTLNIQTTNSKLIFDCPSPTKNESLSFTCTLETLDATLTDGSYEITVTATDQAGNKAEGKTGLMIDRLEPEITFEVFKNSIKVKDGIIYLKENDELELQMTLSETGVPKVQLGGENIDCVETEDRTYTCKTTIKAEIYDEGISDLTVRYEDSAGNLFNQPVVTGIRIDYTGPGLSGDATVVVAKPAGCPLSSVTAAIGGSSVDVSFIVNEILAGDPVVRAVKDTDVVPLVLDSQIGYFYSFTAENIDTGSIADGTYAIEIELVDESGNHSKTVSSSFNIMTVKPAAPAVDVADTIIYRRIPWGSDATGGIKYYGIKAGADAVDVNAVWVYAYDGSDPATASEIGKAPVTNKTFSEFELNRADRTDIYIAAYDTACNRSDAVKVRDVEWTATMGYKEPGDLFKNPHSFYTTGFMSPTLEQKSVALQEPFDGGSALTLQTGSSIWVQRAENTEEPSAEYSFAMVYDSIHGKTVLFGGYKSPAVDETWEWDGMLWSKSDPARKPSARSGHAMAYDSARGRVVLFGGAVGAGPSDETWEWDGTNWTQIYPENKPSARYYHAMTYDSARGKVVLFGGRDGSNYSDETWEWDGTDWIQMNPVNVPSARESHALVYDSAREKVVLFGGYAYSDESIYFDETWEWDGTDWIQMNPVNVPSARKSHTLAYDSVKEKIVLFGGYDGTAYNNETWEWDGTNWSQMNPVNKPSARSSHGMVFDKVAGKMFMFSGIGGGKEMWEWDGIDWLYVNPVSIPSAGKLSAMAFDDAHGKMILFGGSSKSGGSSNETWEWGGANWTKLNPATKPSARSGHAMAYDSVRNRIVMFGGSNNETWEWDGSDWTKRTPANSPSSRAHHAMAFDPMRGKVVLFGGYFNQYSCSMETWEWDGNNWTLRNPINSPTARFSHAMAYDGMTGRMLLFGGYNDTVRNNETWAWDGSNWTQLNPATSPSVRQGHTMAYNSKQMRTVLFGGAYGSYNNETWEWDGTNWNQYNPSNKPSARYLHAMAYDVAREEILLFGGVADTSAIIDTETWRWRGDWVQVNKYASPAVRTGHTIIYDSAVKQSILFGGYTTTYNDETWGWNGSAWTQLNSNKKPSARTSYAMAYDSVREKVVLFGGLLNNETWEWDVTGWTRKYPATSPSARWYSSMVYDFSTGKTVLFGGYSSNGSVTSIYNETWEWDGVNWSQKNPANKPSNRSGHAMAYDISRSRLVLFGGSSGSDETWEWDGSNWTQFDPASKPPAQSSGHKMIYDISRNKVVVFGSEIWEWDGVDWTRCESVNKPTSLSDFSITYDELRNKSVLFGKTSLDKKDETWEWDSGGDDRPSQIMTILWESSGVTDEKIIRSLSVLFNAGGIGDYTGTPYEGVDLLAWMHDRWVTVSYNEAGIDSLEPVTWETTDPVEIQTILNSGLRKFNFAVVPTAPNGFLTDMGNIATDYAEVVVRYRIP